MKALFSTMIDIKKTVRNELLNVDADNMAPYKIDHIREAIIKNTFLDKIIFKKLLPGTCSSGAEGISGKYKLREYRKNPLAPVEFHAEVIIPPGGNYCERRFIACKEMCQAVVEEGLGRGIRVTTLGEGRTLVHMLLSSGEDSTNLNMNEQYLSEKLAEAVARELLVPIEDRIALLDDYEKRNVTMHQLAQKFRIPKKNIPGLFDRNSINVLEDDLTRP